MQPPNTSTGLWYSIPPFCQNGRLLFGPKQHIPATSCFRQVTGDASSFARRALVASVSHAGRPVEPVSLSAAIDISPPSNADLEAPAVSREDRPGPLGGAVLIEQVKKAGAIEEVYIYIDIDIDIDI